MLYSDKVYGSVKIDEPVILEIINSADFQRLKGVDQSGYRAFWFKGYEEVGELDNSRYAHSIGVFLLLRAYGASMEEQISGLIHDLSHSAFSHCIDYVLADGSAGNQDHQDNIFDDFVRRSAIAGIIEKYGFNLEYILNDSNFPLKERDLPDLCADRIDYSLRHGMIFKIISEEDKKMILDNLKAQNGQWYFETLESAKVFAEMFSQLNKNQWSGFASSWQFKVVGDYLKHALKKGYVQVEDFYTTDREVLEKIAAYHAEDEQLNLYFARMNKEILAFNDENDFEEALHCKSRAINPFYSEMNQLKRLSDGYPAWAERVNAETKAKRYFLRFER